MSLARFKDAQAAAHGGFATALAELQAGCKRSHWIWYIFPQLAGLGHSSMARLYGLQDADEAAEYLSDAELRARLLAATNAVAIQLGRGTSLVELMGGEIDALKVVSSLTLFSAVARRLRRAEGGFAELADAVLATAAQQGFPRCAFTLAQIDAAPDY